MTFSASGKPVFIGGPEAIFALVDILSLRILFRLYSSKITKKSENTYKFNQTFRKGNSRGLVFMGIEEMKAVDIRTVVPESLVDVTGTLISDDMTKE